ncbi:hypothetical protein J6590_042785 [Homalodisca vitripennis]|nr:hypothetical protein J6590_042785 [Homalodisca vitripennis]
MAPGRLFAVSHQIRNISATGENRAIALYTLVHCDQYGPSSSANTKRLNKRVASVNKTVPGAVTDAWANLQPVTQAIVRGLSTTGHRRWRSVWSGDRGTTDIAVRVVDKTKRVPRDTASAQLFVGTSVSLRRNGHCD